MLVLAGCFTQHVETMSRPTVLRLRFAERCDGAVLEQYRPDRSVPIAITDETADVEVPAMRGGYRERNGRVSDVHDPYAYGNLTVRKDDRVLVELSVNDVRALPVDPEGRAIVRAPCRR